MTNQLNFFNEIKLNRHMLIPQLTDNEREGLIKNYHPDFRNKGKKELTFGPNKGQLLVEEIVDLLSQKKSDVNFTNDISTDILILGGGGAGIAAALETSSYNLETIIITKDKLGASNTVLAKGGMSVAVGKDDSPLIHAQDTINSGKCNDPALVNILTSEGPQQIEWLERMGMKFDMKNEQEYELSQGGGHTRKRLITNKGRIGPPLIKTLLNALAKSNCSSKTFHELIRLEVDNLGNCCGAIVLNLKEKKYLRIRSKAVILATGGLGALRLYGYPTTNHPTAKGDGLKAAYQLNIEMIDMDSIQFHPTGIIYPEKLEGQLASEKLRSLGAQLYNSLGHPFINPLETRDVVVSAILREIEEGRGIKIPNGNKGVILDIANINEVKIKNLFPNIKSAFSPLDINYNECFLIVAPVIHYQNGGIKIDEHGRTSIKRLWAAGEVTGGIHGKNRLGGNALTDILVFGRRAGNSAAQYILEKKNNFKA